MYRQQLCESSCEMQVIAFHDLVFVTPWSAFMQRTGRWLAWYFFSQEDPMLFFFEDGSASDSSKSTNWENALPSAASEIPTVKLMLGRLEGKWSVECLNPKAWGPNDFFIPGLRRFWCSFSDFSGATYYPYGHDRTKRCCWNQLFGHSGGTGLDL